MKKIGLIIIACLLVGGCSQKPSPEEMFKMVEDARTVSNLEVGMNAEIEMNIKIKVDETEEEMKMTGAMVMDNSDPANLAYKISLGMQVQDQSIEIVQYYTDGYMYTDMLGMKVKQTMSMNDAMLQAQNISSASQQFNLEMFENAKLSKNGKQTVIMMDVPGEMMNEQSAALMEQFNLGELDGVDMEYGKVSVKHIIDENGYIEEEGMVIPVKVSANGQLMEMTMSMNLKYLNVGQPIVVEFPDFSDYIEQEIIE